MPNPGLGGDSFGAPTAAFAAVGYLAGHASSRKPAAPGEVLASLREGRG